MKSAPVIVTAVPGCPLEGENPETVGMGIMIGITVKLYADVAVLSPTVTVMIPDDAVPGTITVREFFVAVRTVARTLLKQTISFAVVVLNSDPDMVVVLPGCPDEG